MSLLRAELSKFTNESVSCYDSAKSMYVLLTDNLMPQQVLSCRNTGWDIECHLALIRNETVDTPSLVGSNVAILVYLEPFEARDVGLGSAWNGSSSA